MLLKRYGIVFRDLLARETNLPKWRELQMAFRRLEDRGEIRGGRFVDGFLGEQFALPVAVESLRATRKMPHTGETIVLSAADPLNLVGILVPGERVPAISGKTVTFTDGGVVQTQSRGFATLDREWASEESSSRFAKTDPVVSDSEFLAVSAEKYDREPDEGVPRIPGPALPGRTSESASPVAFCQATRYPARARIPPSWSSDQSFASISHVSH